MAMLEINEANAGQTVSLTVGHMMELRLKENPTTGFRWHANKTGEPVCRIKEDFQEPANAALPGQATSHVWRIEGVRPGACELSLAYARAWEGGQPPASTFAVRIDVTE